MSDVPPDLTKVSYTLAEVSNIKHNILVGRPYANRASLGFAIRIFELEREYGEREDVLREIDALEGLGPQTNTKSARQFKRPPLKPFWHKHFTTGRHLNRNIGSRWDVDRGGMGNRDLDRMIADASREYGGDPELWPKKMTYDFYIGALEERSTEQRMTGDWIIYAEHDGNNYYLDLATHEEGTSKPELLFDKIKSGSAAEFSFLFK